MQDAFMKLCLPGVTLLRPRIRVRPSHASPLLPYQVEKLMYFTPGMWKQGESIISDSVDSGLLHFTLKLCPGGDAAVNIPKGTWAISAFVQMRPKQHWPEAWEFRE